MKDRRGRPYVRKRCTLCGHTEEVRPAQRRCHRRKFGPRSYCCWGRLERVQPKVRLKFTGAPVQGFATVSPEVLSRLAAKGDEAVHVKQARRPQDEAQKKLEHARKKVTEISRRIARLSTSLRLWERRCTHNAKRASMTDAEVAADRQRRIDRAARRPVRRGIRLRGGA